MSDKASVFLKTRNFLTRWMTISFWKRTLLHGVSLFFRSSLFLFLTYFLHFLFLLLCLIFPSLFPTIIILFSFILFVLFFVVFFCNCSTLISLFLFLICFVFNICLQFLFCTLFLSFFVCLLFRSSISRFLQIRKKTTEQACGVSLRGAWFKSRLGDRLS
jgi:hypothetical protein